MGNLTLSEKYGIVAALALAIVAFINNAILMLAVSVIGILAGAWVLRQGEARRVGYVAFGGFAIVAVFAIIQLVRFR